MNARLQRLWDLLRTSLWVVPAGLTAAAALLAFGCIALDARAIITPDGPLGWLTAGGAEGARAILSTIAGSMITVAGVTFSITIVALTLASSQFGPRLLRNFMRDRVNQLVLGTFIATYVYCLLVLRAVRGENHHAFVPHLSVTVGLALSIVSMGVLMYFIHHVSASIQANSVIRAAYLETDAAIDRLFPQRLGESSTAARTDVDENVFAHITRDGKRLDAQDIGYIQAVDGPTIMRIATDRDLVIRFHARPGDFLIRGAPVASVWPPQRADNAATCEILGAIVMGPRRTLIQDTEFGISQMTEIACRALSPGINDPFTAAECVDHLAATLGSLAARDLPSPVRADDRGTIRVIAPVLTFPKAAHSAFDLIRHYGRSHAMVLTHILRAITTLAPLVRRTADRDALRHHAERVHEAAQQAIPDTDDLAALQALYARALKALDDAPLARQPHNPA